MKLKEPPDNGTSYLVIDADCQGVGVVVGADVVVAPALVAVATVVVVSYLEANYLVVDPIESAFADVAVVAILKICSLQMNSWIICNHSGT